MDLKTGSNTIGGTAAGASNVFGFNSTAGLVVIGANELIIGNLFGTDTNGLSLQNFLGLDVQSGSNTIGGAAAGSGNVFGPNEAAGLQINGAAGTNNLVLGNYFGTNANNAKFANITELLLDSGSNTIGGTSAGSGNTFGFSTVAGLEIRGPGATNNVVEGNSFGTNASGANLGNVVGLSVGGGSNTIGGTSAGAGNVFANSSSAGARFAGDVAASNGLSGNLVGTHASGMNLKNAVGFDVESGGKTNGGTTPGDRNIISFNNTAGVEINGSGASGNVILGNLIGTDSSGQVAAFGNDIGVLISGGSANMIGATTAGAGNVISGNFTAGVEINGSSASSTQIVGNRIGTDPTGTSARRHARYWRCGFRSARPFRTPESRSSGRLETPWVGPARQQT